MGMSPAAAYTPGDGPMRLPRLKMQQALVLIAVASVWLWLEMIDWIVLAGGTIVLALMLVSLRNRGRVAGEIGAEVGRTRPLSVAGIIGYSIAVLLALAWVVCIWAWQVIDHETSKNRARPATPVGRAKPSP